MSEATMPSTTPPAGQPAQAVVSRPPARSFLRLVLSRTMIRWGARVGVLWVACMALAAVFAPFIANSHPLLMKQDGQWSSPLLVHLTLNDVLLLLAFGLGVLALFMKNVRVPSRVLSWVVVMGLVIPASWWGQTLQPFFRQGALSTVSDPVSRGVWWMVLAGLVIYVLVLAWVVIAFVRSRGLTLPWKIGVLIVAAGLMAWLIVKPIAPPRLVEYDRYRVAAAAGQIEWKLHTPIAFSPADRLRDQPGMRLAPPDRDHWMGTTNLGADLAANMIYATRIALSIGFISTGIAVCIGVFIGGMMGYYSGWVDLLGMRLVEIFSAIPTLILLLAFVAAFGANLYIMMVIIGLTSWVGDAVFTRAEFLKLRKQDFVQAAIAMGLPLRSVLFRHMLPNGIAPVLVSASFGVAGAILAESTLSFLGIGLKEEASWGKMLNDALGSGGTFYWWLALYPGLAIFLTVLAYNLVGEALRDAIDPHLQKAAHL